MNFPKILFINISFRNDSSDGITISKLFEKYPKDNLSSITFSVKKDNLDLVGNYFLLDKNDVGKTINLIDNVRKSNGIKNKNIKKIFRITVGIRKETKYILSETFKCWFKSINPDFIYINPDSKYDLIKLTLDLADIFNKNIIVHVLDDKVNFRFPGLFGYYYNYRLKKIYEMLISKSSVRFCISTLMKKEYEIKYKNLFHVIHNSVNIKNYVNTIRRQNKGYIGISYWGVLDYNYKTILLMARVIDELNKNIYNIRFVIYTKNDDIRKFKKLLDCKCVVVKEFLSQDKIASDIANYDYLFLPLPFDRKQKFTRLSLPSKLSEYLASGSPIIVLAPADTALTDYCYRNDIAYVMTNTNKKYLYSSMKKVLEEVDWTVKRENCRIIAEREHNKSEYQKYVLDLLSKYNNQK